MLIPGPWSPGGIRPEPSEATWVRFKRNLLDGISRRSDQLSSISHVCCSAARGLIGSPGGPLATCANGRLERWTGKAGSPVCLPGLFPAGFGPTWRTPPGGHAPPPNAQPCANSAHLIEFASDVDGQVSHHAFHLCQQQQHFRSLQVPTCVLSI